MNIILELNHREGIMLATDELFCQTNDKYINILFLLINYTLRTLLIIEYYF